MYPIVLDLENALTEFSSFLKDEIRIIFLLNEEKKLKPYTQFFQIIDLELGKYNTSKYWWSLNPWIMSKFWSNRIDINCTFTYGVAVSFLYLKYVEGHDLDNFSK